MRPTKPLLIATLLTATLFEALGQTEAPATSTPAGTQEQARFNEAMLREMKDLRAEIERMRAKADETRAQVEKVMERTEEPAPVASGPSDQSGTATPTSANAAPGDLAPDLNDEAYRLERERAIRSVQRSGVLLKRNEWEVESSFAYSHSSSNVIGVDGLSVLPILVVGEIEGLRVERDVFQASLTLRYGVLDNLQAEVMVPYRYERDRFVRQVDKVEKKEERTSGHGMGDVEFGLSYQMFYEHGLVPDLIVSLRARAPTGEDQFELGRSDGDIPMGSGIWGVRGGLTAIKALDPIVLILSAGYTWNADRDITIEVPDADNPGTTRRRDTTFEPGGMVDWGLGVALAVNPALALNFQIQQRVSFGNSVGGFGRMVGTSGNQADFRFGFGWALSHDVIVNFVSAAGLTEDTPDLTTSLGFAMKF